jgi:hypothetical protein
LKIYDLGALLEAPRSPLKQQNWFQWDHLITGGQGLRTALRFPNLRCLILDGLTHFESAGSNLCDTGDEEDTVPVSEHLIMFGAVRCRELDCAELLEPSHQPNLMYLDLSYTNQGASWYRSFASLDLPNLRILKLRGLRLTHHVVEAILQRLKDTLWSLDLRDNLLKDPTLGYLLLCCSFSYNTTHAPPQYSHDNQIMIYEQPPAYYRDHARETPINGGPTVPLRPDTKAPFLKYIQTRGAPESGQSNDDLTKRTGITHLYISDNSFTSSTIHGFLQHINGLQVLDIGSIVRTFGQAPPATRLLCLDDLNPYFHHNHLSRLEVLRIHHSLVTCTPTIATTSGTAYSPQHLELSDEIGRNQSLSRKPFTPLSNYRLRHLTLTSVPTKSRSFLITNLISFLRDCATQERTLAAATHPSHSRRAPQLLSGLQTLRLEFLPVEEGAAAEVSVSGDRDAETFLEESRADFSFFDRPPNTTPFAARGREEGEVEVEDQRPSTSSSSSSRMPQWVEKIVKRPGSLGKWKEKEVVEKGAVLDVAEELRKWRAGVGEEERWGGKLELVVPK